MARSDSLEAFAAQIGAAIVRERKAAGKSQEDLAYEAEMSVRHLRELENGAANPTIKTLHRLSDALGIDVRALFAEPTREKRPRPKRRH